MEYFNITNTSQDDFYDYLNTAYEYHENRTVDHDHEKAYRIMNIVTCIIISVGLPLTLLAIYALYSMAALSEDEGRMWPTGCQLPIPAIDSVHFIVGNDVAASKVFPVPEVVRGNHVAPIYVINLLISDLIQFCSMIVTVAAPEDHKMIGHFFYLLSLFASIGFMVCIALERYLVIACPLWYRFRRTVKITVAVSVAIWVLSLAIILYLFLGVSYMAEKIIFGVVLLLPLPLLIFFLGGTIRALSASHVTADEKRRIVGILVLVLLIYTLLFLPTIILVVAEEDTFDTWTLGNLSAMFVLLSPLADLLLYVFMRKGIIDKLLATMCWCRMDSNDSSRTKSNGSSSSSV